MARRCPYCKSKKVVLNQDRLWVCADCGTESFLVRIMTISISTKSELGFK